VRLRLAGPKAAVVADLGFDEATRRFVRARFQQMTR
jgi:hypothetical protein